MEKTKKCSECKASIVFKNNEYYCSKCGLVIEDSPIVSSATYTKEGGKLGYSKGQTYLEPYIGSYIDAKDIKKISRKIKI